MSRVVKVRITAAAVYVDGRARLTGEEVVVPAEDAEALVAQGVAEEAEAKGRGRRP